MKAYLCQTEVGPQYIHLQADAKKIDPAFETEEIDLSKAAIMTRLNELMRRAFVAENGSGIAEEETVAVSPSPPQPKPVPQAMPPHAARNDAQIAWEEFLLGIPANEAYRLDSLQHLIEARRAEIEKGIP